MILDYEQKYKEALARAIELLNSTKAFDKKHDIRTTVYNIFPELKESEDERIRKAIIGLIKEIKNQPLKRLEDWDKYIAWLEKQGEHAKFCDSIQVGDKVTRNRDGMLVNLSQLKRVAKPTDKVEQKFKAGKWYQCTKDFFGKGVTFDKNTAYYCAKEGCLQDEYGCHIAIVKDLYDNFKLWTIEDAKDGDVLCLGSVIAIFKSIFKNSIGSPKCVCYCSYCKGGGFEIPIENGEDNVYGCTNTTPATKEQHDVLFQKMKEAGYKWAADKKKPIKL